MTCRLVGVIMKDFSIYLKLPPTHYWCRESAAEMQLQNEKSKDLSWHYNIIHSFIVYKRYNHYGIYQSWIDCYNLLAWMYGIHLQSTTTTLPDYVRKNYNQCTITNMTPNSLDEVHNFVERMSDSSFISENAPFLLDMFSTYTIYCFSLEEA